MQRKTEPKKLQNKKLPSNTPTHIQVSVLRFFGLRTLLHFQNLSALKTFCTGGLYLPLSTKFNFISHILFIYMLKYSWFTILC